MAFRSDGIGFLTTALNPSTFGPANDLYSFNITTGTSSLIASNPDGPTLAGLAFIGNTLYGLGKLDDTLYTVNQATGTTTAVGFLGVGNGSPFESLSSGPAGTLFATLDDRLYRINASTGLATPIDPDPWKRHWFQQYFEGLTYVATVPGPSSVILVTVGLASGLVVRTRRRVDR